MDVIRKLFKDKPYYKYRLPSVKGKLYLIQWNPNQYTDIHKHDGNDCHFYILKGPLNETVYNKDFQIIHKTTYQKKDMGFINDNIGYHKMRNTSNEYKWSLHLYQ
tara:strand:- start:49 stop:363 length:315 start_codon:yes stop_codon:yes gene_type:complete